MLSLKFDLDDAIGSTRDPQGFRSIWNAAVRLAVLRRETKRFVLGIHPYRHYSRLAALFPVRRIGHR